MLLLLVTGLVRYELLISGGWVLAEGHWGEAVTQRRTRMAEKMQSCDDDDDRLDSKLLKQPIVNEKSADLVFQCGSTSHSVEIVDRNQRGL